MFHDKYVDSKAAISGIDCFFVVNGKNCPSINFMKSHKIYSNIHCPGKNKIGGKKMFVMAHWCLEDFHLRRKWSAKRKSRSDSRQIQKFLY